MAMVGETARRKHGGAKLEDYEVISVKVLRFEHYFVKN